MKLVVDANVVISALIADSKTRELIVTLEPGLLTPEFVHDEIENYTQLIVGKSGMSPERVTYSIRTSLTPVLFDGESTVLYGARVIHEILENAKA